MLVHACLGLGEQHHAEAEDCRELADLFNTTEIAGEPIRQLPRQCALTAAGQQCSKCAAEGVRCFVPAQWYTVGETRGLLATGKFVLSSGKLSI